MEAFLQVSISKYCLPYRHSSMKKPLYGRQYRAEISIINVPMWHKQDITNLYHIWCHFLFQLKTVTSSINHKPATQAWLGLNRQVLFDQPLTNPVRRAKRVVEVSKEYQYLQDTQEPHSKVFSTIFCCFLMRSISISHPVSLLVVSVINYNF